MPPPRRAPCEVLLCGTVYVHVSSVLVDVGVQISVAIAVGFDLISAVRFADKVSVEKVRPIIFIESLCSSHLLVRYVHNVRRRYLAMQFLRHT